MLEKSVLPRVQRLAAKYKISPLDLSRIQTKYSSELPDLPLTTVDDQIDQISYNLYLLARKRKQDKSAELAAQLQSEVERYVALVKALDESSTRFELFARAGILSDVINILGDDDAAKILIEELFRFLEHPMPKEREPAGWILSVRTMLNLTKHPSPVLAERVRQRLAQSIDADVHAYFSVDKLVRGVVSEYYEDPLQNPAKVTGKY
jgi:hypothetical protein